MRKILLDTNSLMAIGEFKIDLFSEISKCCSFHFQLKVLSGTIDELKKIKLEQRGKYKSAASLALNLVRSKKISIIPSEGNVDDVLVKESENNLVLTQDLALKRRLHKPYLTIRQKKRIVMVK